MAYWQWGDSGAGHVIVCVHGLSRQGRDFDVLAQALVARASAAAADRLPRRGRARPQRLAEGPDGLPGAPVRGRHAGHAGAVAPASAGHHPGLGRHQHGRADRDGGLRHARAGAGHVQGPRAAAGRRCAALVLNDVGPVIQWQALQRIGTYLGKTGRFETVQQAADAMWAISTSFGPHTPEQWLALSQPMVRALPDGGFTLHYDPAIAVPFRSLTEESAAQGEAALWQFYDHIQRPHPAHARRAVGPAVARHGAGHDAARPEGPPDRVSRRRTCTDLDRRQPGRGGGLVPAGTIRR